VVAEDITARKKAEQESQQQAKFINAVAGATADILFVMDIDTKKILYTSREVAKDLGYQLEQIQQMKEPYFAVMHPDDVPEMITHIEHMRNARDGEVREVEYRLRHADGSYHFYCDRNTVFKRDEKGNVIEKLGIAQDITERKTDEMQIKKPGKLYTAYH
jgi:PAS domain S-box-containing protein